jgi:hypothetical protein
VREEEAEETLMRRYSFVVQVHPDGVSTLENLSTRERVRVGDLGEVGPKIESWLALLEAPRPPEVAAAADSADRDGVGG